MGPSNARRPGLGTAVTKGTGADGSGRPGFRHLPRVLEGLHVPHGRRGEGREPRGHGPTPLVEGVRPPGVTIFKGGCYRNGPYSSPVLARKPASSAGRYCIRLSRVFTSAVSSAMVCLVRLASDRFRCAHTGSTGLSSWA